MLNEPSDVQLRPPTVIGQFHTLFFGSIRMFFLGVLGFAVYGNEALHFSCDPDKREVNLFCYNQFRPITPQVNIFSLFFFFHGKNPMQKKMQKLKHDC